MSARAWDKIDYSRVASVCMKNNKKQFEVRIFRDSCIQMKRQHDSVKNQHRLACSA